MKKLKRDKFALLAKVGHRKREVSLLQDEADFYCGSAIGLHALLADQQQLLEMLAEATGNPHLKGRVADFISRHNQLIRPLLNFWPSGSESQQRLLSLLGSDGLAKVMESTREGYVSLSTTQVLRNVELAIEATKDSSRKTSSSYGMKTASQAVGIAGVAEATP